MLRITKHIEQLLLLHDCVIIPQIGGFVLQAIPASSRTEENYFQPMRKEVVFNSALQHRDGLLHDSYMQTYHIDYHKAEKMVEDDISEIKNTLRQYGKVNFDKIGSLTFGSEGQYVFHPGKTDLLAMDYYGMNSFHFPALPVLEKDEEGIIITPTRKKDIFYIPVNMRFVRGMVSAAAAILLFFIVSTPVKDVRKSSYTAGIIPHELLSKSIPHAMEEVTAEEEIKVEEVVSPVETITEPVVKPKTYHIIIGSFPNEAKANDYISGIDKNTYSETGIVVRDGRYRVYAHKFFDRSEAERYLSTIRETEKYKDAWLFISR